VVTQGSSVSALPDEVELREVAPQPVASVRLGRTPAALPAAFDEFLPIIGRRLLEVGGQIVGAPFARYHGMAAGEFDVEIGLPATGIGGLPALANAASGEVGSSQLPGGRMAVYVHTGPYAGIGRAWDMLNAWLAAQHLAAAAPGWDSYVDNPDDTPAERLRTEIVQPIR
jgi:effector-binding domain-containing protein